MWASKLVNFFTSVASMVPFFTALESPTMETQESTCVNPAQRREWRTLSVTERAEWISAIKCVADLPHNASVVETQFDPTQPRLNPNSSYYDDLTFVHNDLVGIIHGTGYFLSWHRNHVHTMETAMRAHCGYKGVPPYWDWTLDAPDFEHSDFWNDSDPKSGLGGWGNPDSNAEVQDGAFAGFKLAYPYPHVLRRRFRPRPWLNTLWGSMFHIDPLRMVNESFTRAEVDRIVNGHVGDYRGFQASMAALPGMHSSLHAIVGGDLGGECPSNNPGLKCSVGLSPNEPLFYLHHGMIDKIWYDWQNAHPANRNAFSGGSVEHMESTEAFDRYPVGGPPDLDITSVLPSNGLHGTVTIGNVLSTTGGYLCYVYV